MKWYSYSIVHPIECEYEYCPSGGVRVRKTQGNWNVMFKDGGKDEAYFHRFPVRLRLTVKHTMLFSQTILTGESMAGKLRNAPIA